MRRALELAWRQTLLREWTTSQFIPLFSLDEGTAAFTEDAAIEREICDHSSSSVKIHGVFRVHASTA